MLVTKSLRTNYGFGYPDINYSGVNVVPGPWGLGGISTTNGLILVGIAVGLYYFFKSK